MAPNQGCLIDPLLTISASTVSSTVTGTGKVGGSPTPSHWKHRRYFIHQQHASQIQFADISLKFGMNYEDDEDGMKGMILFLPWSHVPNFNSMAAIFQGPLGPGSLQVDESHVEQSFQLFAAKVQAVHQEVPGGGGADGITG